MKIPACHQLIAMACSLATIAIADVPPPVALRAREGALVAMAQLATNPNKPYVAQLFAPGAESIPLLDDAPSDHPHHHGLMFALGVDDTDFWAEKGIKNAGVQQVATSMPEQTGDGFGQNLRWLAADGTPLLEESRRVRVRAAGSGVDAIHWLDWESTLSPAAGRASVRLTGHHYFGLGMRFLPSWSNKVEFIWQDATNQGATVRGDERLTPGDWCAAQRTIGDRPITVMMLAHPANPRPARWFTMGKPFCYQATALNLDKEPAILAKGTSWTFRYSLAVLSSPADHTRLAGIAAGWKSANPFQLSVKPPPAKL
jgi:hypothetical protein